MNQLSSCYEHNHVLAAERPNVYSEGYAKRSLAPAERKVPVRHFAPAELQGSLGILFYKHCVPPGRSPRS
jgi:hypothetical protein